MKLRYALGILVLVVMGAVRPLPAVASSAPQWMHQLTGAALPAHDDRTEAVLMYSDLSVSVESAGPIKSVERKVYKILRPGFLKRGRLVFITDGTSRVTDLHAWSIPPSGKDYEVKKRDAVESAPDVENGVLVTDVRALVLQVPAAESGSFVGYEITREGTPLVLTEEWSFQDTIPVREAHYQLRLPKGWSYKATWLNHAEAAPVASTDNQWHWSVSEVAAIRSEPHMPAPMALAGRMFVALIPPQGQGQPIQTWSDVGSWYANLTRDRRNPSPEISDKVRELTAGAPTLLAKMEALARFVQDDVRYVAISLGIGGYQPHAAADVFSHRYGDCKDKATLLSAMFEEIGVKSFYVIIDSARGVVTRASPPSPYFNHAILAAELPSDVDDPSIEATVVHPQLGRLLFFDPTDDITAFGDLSGALQDNFGLLITPGGGELIELPHLPVSSNGIARTATLSLDEHGTLRGDVRETRVGLRAAQQRYALRNDRADTDQIKPVESLLAASLPTFEITKASIANLRALNKPFEWRYSVVADNYARTAGELLFVRPRVIGSKAEGFLETKERREYAIEFAELERDTDAFEISLPQGYELDELPARVDVDAGFAAYHSKTEVVGRTLKYSRSYEILQLSVPPDKASDLKALYRAIETDERSAAVFKRVSP